MNMYTLFLISISIFSLVSCSGEVELPNPPTKNAPTDNPIIGIVPSRGAPRTDYCKINGNDLVITFANSGGIASSSGTGVTVTFGSVPIGPQIMPAIQPGASVDMNFQIPNGCFSSDCSFSIQWSNQPIVSGICIG